MGQVLRAVFSLKGIQRAPEQSGKLKRFKDHERPELRWAYLDEEKKVSAWPTSLHITVRHTPGDIDECFSEPYTRSTV